MAKRYTDDFKFQAVQQYQNGASATALCQQLGIARSTLFLWVKQHAQNKTDRISREQYLLQKEVERLRAENAIFKSCGCSPTSPLAVRLAAICAHKDEFSIHELCRTLSVRRSTYYYHTLRAPEQTQLQKEDAHLKPVISQIFEKSGRRFGVRRIRTKLLELGYTISERRTSRLMKELGLSSKGVRPHLNSANDCQYQYYSNKLKRQFLTDTPNKVWVSDITYAKVGMDFVHTPDQQLHLHGILAPPSRKGAPLHESKERDLYNWRSTGNCDYINWRSHHAKLSGDLETG